MSDPIEPSLLRADDSPENEETEPNIEPNIDLIKEFNGNGVEMETETESEV